MLKHSAFQSLESRRLLASVATVPFNELRINPHTAVRFGSLVYFVGRNDATGSELWTTDGTAKGTRLFLDLRKGAESGCSDSRLIVSGNYLYFSGTNGKSTGNGLWRTDGTAAGTIFLNRFSGWDENSEFLLTTATYKGQLFFNFKSTLWLTAGTPGTTRQIKDLTGNSRDPRPQELLTTNAGVYFFTGSIDRELWRTTGTSKSTRIVSRAISSSVSLVGDKLLAVGTADNGRSGLVSVAADNSVSLIEAGEFDVESSLEDAAAVYAWRKQTVRGEQVSTLVRRDVTASKSLYANDPEYAPNLIKLIPGGVIGQDGDSLIAIDVGGAGLVELIDFSDTVQNTELEIDEVVGLNPRAYVAVTFHNSAYKPQVWATDGTISGTFKIADINYNYPQLPYIVNWPLFNAIELNGSHLIFTINALHRVNTSLSVDGRVFLDANGNGKRESSETNLRNLRLYIDLDGDGRYDFGEPTARSNSSGRLSINDLAAGTYTARAIAPSGHTLTTRSKLPIKITSGQKASVVIGAKS